MSLYLPIAEMSLNGLLLLAMGLSVGVLSGMFGIGGGFILTPMLILMGVPPAVAVGTGASQVVASSVSGTIGHWQRGNIDVRMGLLLLAGGCLGTLTGVKLQQILRELGQLDLFISLTYVIVLGSIGALMFIEGLRTWHRSKEAVVPRFRRGGTHTWVQGLPFKLRFPRSKLYMSAVPALTIGAFVGWLTAVMGVGGGFLLVPALIYLIGMSTRVAIGTSVFQIVFVTAVTTVLQAQQNHTVDVLLAAPLMLGGVIGAQYGIRVAERMQAEQLRILLAILVLGVAGRMAYDLVQTPTERFNLEVLDVAASHTPNE